MSLLHVMEQDARVLLDESVTIVSSLISHVIDSECLPNLIRKSLLRAFSVLTQV